MNEKTHFLDYASLLVPSLKQHALVKIAKTLIRHDLEEFYYTHSLVYKKPFKRFSANIEQLCIPKSCQDDMCRVILGLYNNLQYMESAKSVSPSTVKFDARGEVDVHGTFDDCMEQWICWPPPPRRCLLKYLRDACRYQQVRCVHLLLCELVKWKRSELEPSLRNAKREVEVRRENSHYYCDMRFMIGDVIDSAQWTSFADMLTNNFEVPKDTECSFEGNEFTVSVSIQDILCRRMSLLWPKMTTMLKYEHAANIFEIALQRSDICLLIQTMRYVDTSKRMDLIKKNLVSFILSFLTHPYFRHFLPDLQLVEEDLQLVQEEDEVEVLDLLLSSLEFVGDCTGILDSLVELWRYVAVRDKSLGDHVMRNIKEFVKEMEDVWEF